MLLAELHLYPSPSIPTCGVASTQQQCRRLAGPLCRNVHSGSSSGSPWSSIQLHSPRQPPRQSSRKRGVGLKSFATAQVASPAFQYT